jgi:CRP/FNR family transcriptional regulator
MKGFENGLKCLDCKHCFKKSDTFKLLSEEELDFLNSSRMEAHFKEGEIIYKQGTPLSHLVIISSGFAKIYIEGAKGRDLILSYTKPLDINGGIGVFIDKRHHSSLMAVTDCEACFIEVEAFKEILRKNSAFMESYMRLYSQKVQHTYHQFAVLTQKNMEGRMAEVILYLQDKVFSNGSIDNIPKQDLAELTAMTKESAIRVIKEFKDDGLIEVKGKVIKIIDHQGLEMIARHG